MPYLTELLGFYQGSVSIEGNAETLGVTGITADSRKVTRGSIFVAISGAKADGLVYAMDAVAAGAVAIIIEGEQKLVLPKSIVIIRVDNARLALAKLASAFYPQLPRYICAVTGTDGKTSTVDFLRQLWQMDGKKAASIGTIGVIGTDSQLLFPSDNTTPDAVTLQQQMQELAKAGYEYVAMEASSHGLHQYRLDGVRIAAAAFTNLSREHLDYHETQEAYFHAKARLFTEVLAAEGTAVLNADDVKFKRLKKMCDDRRLKVFSYGFQGEQLKIRKITPKLDGMAIQAELFGTSQHFRLNMIGEFQALNALAALGLYIGVGGDKEAGLKHLPHLHNVAGRLEKVGNHENGAAIFVDYAHTPAALGNVLKTMRPHIRGKLWVVFGCGGNRDASKRVEMGKIANELADEVIITDDNPRNETPATIRSEIMFGVPRAKNIGDRAEAIATAIRGLHSEDVLLIAGKGHENIQIIGNRTIPFNDADVVRGLIHPQEVVAG